MKNVKQKTNELNPPYPPLKRGESLGKGVHKMKNVKCTMKNEIIGEYK